MSEKKLIIIAGPTAVGKTKLTVELAKFFNTEVISADSRQFYKQMQIGTARPSLEELDGVPHHFFNFLEPNQLYSAGDFAKDAKAKITEIHKTKNLVFATGGSGLYLKSLYQNFDEFPEVSNEIRETVNLLFEQNGIKWFQKKIAEVDSIFAAGSEIQNPQRLKRAYEIYLESGKAFSSFKGSAEKITDYKTLKIVIELPREILYQRINQRVDSMINQGLEEEVKNLIPYKNCNALNTVGYKEFFAYFNEQISKDEAIEKVKQHTRNFAKRQITWFKKEDDWHWFNPENKQEIINLIKSF